MGTSCSCTNELTELPPEVKEILNELAEKAPGIVNTFQIEYNKILNERTEILKEREEKVEKAVKEKEKIENEIKEKEAKKENVDKEKELLEKSIKDLCDLLLEYNLKEIDNEKELIINEVDKMHSLYELGLELAEKLKKVTLDQLKKKLDKAPSVSKSLINSQIEQINKYSSKEFLDSEFGKPLKSELEKAGMREDLLKEFMENLEKERKQRRVDERTKYGIEQNEFPPKDELGFTAEDVFKLIFEDYKDEFRSSLKNKVIEICLNKK